MAVSDKTVHVYEELAERHARLNDPRQRDVFLLLAADAACSAGKREQADKLRQRLLAASPDHLLRPFPSFDEALRSPDVQLLMGDLRRQYPPEVAEQMLASRRAEPVTPLPKAAAAAESERDVFRLKETPVVPLAPPVANHAAPVARPAAAPPAPPRVVASPARSPAAPPVRKSSEKGRRSSEPAEGAWVALSLFVLVLLGGLTLAGYTLLGPLFGL